MRAAVFHRYGPPSLVSITDVPRPIPGPREVLVRVRASTVTAADWRLRTATAPRGFGALVRLAFGITGPRRPILGTELAGEVVELGPGVERFSIGDRVFAFRGAALGCHAEFVAIHEDQAIAPMPSKLSFAEAAALSFGGSTALYFLRDRAQLRAGERILINGASGCVGSAAVQLARHFGAQVTAIASGPNRGWVQALGAEQLVDYTQEDFRQRPERYDVILDAVGNLSFPDCEPVLVEGGRMLLVAADLPRILSALLRPQRGGKRVLVGVAPERQADLQVLASLAEAGAYRPAIDRIYPFERITEAHAHVDTGRKKGNVVLRFGEADPRERPLEPQTLSSLGA